MNRKDNDFEKLCIVCGTATRRVCELVWIPGAADALRGPCHPATIPRLLRRLRGCRRDGMDEAEAPWAGDGCLCVCGTAMRST